MQKCNQCKMIINPNMTDAEIRKAIAKASKKHFGKEVTTLEALLRLCECDMEKFNEILEEK